MGSYVLKKAEMDQLSAAMDLISDGKRYLKEQGSDQWQTGYPDETDIREDILRGRGYFVTEEERLLAYLCVDFEGESAYAQIKGRWLTGDSPYGVIHRLAIGKSSRGKGLSSAVFLLAEELCRSRGVGSIRVDTDEKNQIMRHILEKNGFVLCGTIWFAGGDKLAFEKILHKPAHVVHSDV